MVAQGLTPCSGSSASGGVTPGRGDVDNHGWNLLCLPQPTLTGRMCHSLVLPVFTCFYLQCGRRICDLNVWDHHFKSWVPLLRAWDRCQGCCLIVGSIKADSDDERNLSSAEINEMPLQSALLICLWSMGPWEYCLVYISFAGMFHYVATWHFLHHGIAHHNKRVWGASQCQAAKESIYCLLCLQG